MHIQAEGAVCAQVMRDITQSALCHRVLSFQSKINITSENVTNIPTWDDFLEFAKKWSACELLILEGFAFKPISPCLAFSQIHSILMLLVNNQALQRVVLETAVVEDYADGIKFTDFITSINVELNHFLGRQRKILVWGDYNISNNGMPLFRISFQKIKNKSSKGKENMQCLSFINNATNGFSCKQCPIVFVHGLQVSTLRLSQRCNINFHTKTRGNGEIQYEYDQLLHNIIDSPWSQYVASFSLQSDTETIIKFKQCSRSKLNQSKQTVAIYWQDLIDLIARCKFCSSVVLLGNLKAEQGLSVAFSALQTLLQSKTDVCWLHYVCIELLVSQRDFSAVSNGSFRGKFWKTNRAGLSIYDISANAAWYQGVFCCSGHKVLLWACKMQRKPTNGKPKRALNIATHVEKKARISDFVV